MSGISFALALALVLSQGTPTGIPVAALGSQNAVQEELITLDKKVDQAIRSGDIPFLREVLTDDLLRVSQSGERSGKAEILKAAETRGANSAADAIAEMDAALEYTVRLHGETAVVVHTDRRTDNTSAHTVMRVFVRPRGRWKVSGWTESCLALKQKQNL